MAETLNLQMVLKLAGSLDNVLDLGTATLPFAKDYTKTFSNGTGATGDLLHVASNTGSITYDVWIWGEV